MQESADEISRQLQEHCAVLLDIRTVLSSWIYDKVLRVLTCCPININCCWSTRLRSMSWISAFAWSLVSVAFWTCEIVFTVNVLTTSVYGLRKFSHGGEMHVAHQNWFCLELALGYDASCAHIFSNEHYRCVDVPEDAGSCPAGQFGPPITIGEVLHFLVSPNFCVPFCLPECGFSISVWPPSSVVSDCVFVLTWFDVVVVSRPACILLFGAGFCC